MHTEVMLLYKYKYIMEITCLPHIKNYSTKVNINTFLGQIAGVDAYCWIHKSLVISVDLCLRREIGRGEIYYELHIFVFTLKPL